MPGPVETRRFMEALISELWNAADLSTMAKFFTDECVMHLGGDGTRGGEDLNGRETFEWAYIGPTLRDYPGLQHEIKDLAIDGDRVTMRFWGEGAVPPEMLGGRSGQTLRYEGIALFRMANGRIDELWVHSNWDKVMADLAA